jgi:pyrimidine operon attenuation protein/uracil phosphoribosyltransferase
MDEIRRSLILSADDIAKKIERISYEILENNDEEQEIILAGIRQKGFVFAQRLESKLRTIGPVSVILPIFSFKSIDPPDQKY